MSEHEQPQAGGSYIRGEDGKLTRLNAPPAEAPIAKTPAGEAKRGGTSQSKEK